MKESVINAKELQMLCYLFVLVEPCQLGNKYTANKKVQINVYHKSQGSDMNLWNIYQINSSEIGYVVLLQESEYSENHNNILSLSTCVRDFLETYKHEDIINPRALTLLLAKLRKIASRLKGYLLFYLLGV